MGYQREHALSQELDIAGSNTQLDNLSPQDEALGLGVSVNSGTGSSIAVGVSVVLTGLTGMTAASVGNLLQLTGFSNVSNNGVFLITEYISASSVVIDNSSAISETISFSFSERKPYSLEDDLNYVRTDRANIKGTSFESSIPTYARPTNTSIQVPANLLNISGNTLDAKAYVFARKFENASVSIGNTSITITSVGNLRHATSTNITGVPVFDGYDSADQSACYVDIIDPSTGLGLYVLSGLNAGNRIFGRTVTGASSSPNSVQIDLRSVPDGADISSSISYTWESGQPSVVDIFYGYRDSLSSASSSVFRTYESNGIYANSSVNRIIGNRTYTGSVLTDGYTITQSLQELADSLGGAAGIEISKNSGSSIGIRPKINFIEGTNVSINIVDDPGNDEFDITITAAGGAGGGDVTGPTGASDNAVVVFDGISGKILKESLSTISTGGVLSINPSSATPGITLNANAQGQLITGLNSDLVDGYHGSYFLNASNLISGTIPAARFDDTSHGNRGGGALHANATISTSGFMSGADKAKLNAINLDGYATDAELSAALAGYVPTSRILTAGAGLIGGGDLSANRTISLQPGLFDGYARNSSLDGYISGITVRRNSGTNVGTRSRLNFIEGSNITLLVTDDPGNGEVDITITSLGGGTDGYVFQTRQIIAGSGLVGGGDLSANRTISLQPALLDGYALSSRQIIAGTGLIGGGNLTSDRTISLQSGLLDGYATTSIVTSLTNNLQAQINFVEDTMDGYALSSRQIIAGTGLSGGGNLTSNRTLSLQSGLLDGYIRSNVLDGYATKQDIDGYLEGITVRRNSGVNIGTQPRLNFIEGANVTLSIANDPGSNEVDITISSTGSGGGGVGSLFQTLAVGNVTDGYDINLTSGSNINTDDQFAIQVNGTNAAVFGPDTSFVSASVGQVLAKNSNNQLHYVSIPSLPNLDGYVLQTRNINTGTGLVGGGNLTSDRTISLQPGLLDGYSLSSTVTSLTNNLQAQINFVEDALDGYALSSRQIIAGTGLFGGGDLSQNRTISIQQGLLDGYIKSNSLDGYASLVYVNNQDNIIKTSLDGYALNTVTISTGSGLIGGGNLTTNRTIGLQSGLLDGYALTSYVNSQDSGLQVQINTVKSSLDGYLTSEDIDGYIEGITVRRNTGSNVGTQPRLNFIEGSNVAISITNDPGSSEIDITISSSGGGGGGVGSLFQTLAVGNSTDGYDVNFTSGSNINTDDQMAIQVNGTNAAVFGPDTNFVSASVGQVLAKNSSNQLAYISLPSLPSLDGYATTSSVTAITNNLQAQINFVEDTLDGYISGPSLSQDGYVAIANSGGLSYLSGNTDGYVLTWNSGAWTSDYVKRTFMVEFALTEDVDNTSVYFTSYRGAGGDMPTGKRSGSSTGIANADSCSPYQVPFNATIKKAILTLKGAGVANGSVSYPVSYQTELFEQTFTTESKLLDIDFSISNSFTVGTWAVGNTHYKGSTNLNLDIDEGTMVGLKFTHGSGASVVGQSRNAFITLILEER